MGNLLLLQGGYMSLFAGQFQHEIDFTTKRCTKCGKDLTNLLLIGGGATNDKCTAKADKITGMKGWPINKG